MIFRKRYLVIAALMLFLSVGFSGNVVAPIDNYFEISKNLDIFGKLYREVNSFYVDDIDPNKFMRSGIDAMLEGLDPYTTFISASEIEDYRFMSTGQYGGIGAVIGKRDNRIIISEPYFNYPAQKAGLMAGDEIIQIDQEVINPDNSQTVDVRNLLRGQPQTALKLKIVREGVDKPMDFDVIREEIKIDNVPYFGMVDNEIGYISLTGFTRDASNEVKHAFESLKKDNPALKGMILDLRANPGGLLFEAVDISNLFVPQGETIVETRGKIEGSLKVYQGKNNPVDTEIPLAVLINRRSASASEIVSGVMQDLDRGVILGQRSFGKGLVQTTRPLSYNTQLKITTAKYYTPSGRCIQAINYGERDEDGSVVKIPDSLKKAFKTANGRTVYDGGGIEPDLEVKLPEYHTVTRELIRQNMIFDFATHFRVIHPEIPAAREFKITDQIFNDFEAFVKSKNFEFETKTEKEIEKLKELMVEESYEDDLQSDLESIKTKIAREKGNDLRAFKDEISKILKTEIVTRYYYKKGEIEASFDLDNHISDAVKILKDKKKYAEILARNN